jgi:hypothetical protein
MLIYALALANSPTGKMPPSLEQYYWDRQIVQAGGQYSVSQVTLCTVLPLNILALIVYPSFVVAAILEDMSLWHSLRFGWRLLWANFGRLIGFWTILGGVGLVIGFFLLAPASTIKQLLADTVEVHNAVIIIVSMVVSVLFGSIFTVAGVQLYMDCARRLRTAKASSVSPPLAA